MSSLRPDEGRQRRWGILSCACAVLALLASCAAPIREFYPDSYLPEDRIYVNKSLGFSLAYKGNWEIITDPNAMGDGGRKFARSFQEGRGEVLFIGATPEGTQGTRGLAVNLNLSDRAHAEEVRRVNSAELERDLGLVDFIAGDKGMVKWEYFQGGFHFVEFFFTLDTYNIRVAFWTKPGLFERFLPVYESIMTGLRWENRF